jgi:Stage II sporulation protein E (SpoIIE)
LSGAYIDLQQRLRSANHDATIFYCGRWVSSPVNGTPEIAENPVKLFARPRDVVDSRGLMEHRQVREVALMPWLKMVKGDAPGKVFRLNQAVTVLGRDASCEIVLGATAVSNRKPDLPGYEFWHDYEPARCVGGDYFDDRLIPTPEAPLGQPSARWAVAIGDVSGKGMPAALLTTRLSSEASLLLQTEPGPARVVERLNRNLCRTRTDEKFITFLVATLDWQRHELTVANAGHMDPLIRRAGGPVEVIGHDEASPPLGIIDDQTYEMATTSIYPGDVVVLYTDGVNQAADNEGRQFGMERLKQALAAAPAGAGKVGEWILDAVRRHAAGAAQSDAIALICFGRA